VERVISTSNKSPFPLSLGRQALVGSGSSYSITTTIMFSAYRTSVYSIASTASRRVYHKTARSLKASVDRSATVESSSTKVASETVKNEASSSWAKENPFLFQLGVATVKTSAADLVAQMVAERKSLDEVDWKRNAIFVVFGFAYLGGFQYWLMVNKYRQWFPYVERTRRAVRPLERSIASLNRSLTILLISCPLQNNGSVRQALVCRETKRYGWYFGRSQNGCVRYYDPFAPYLFSNILHCQRIRRGT
jgi:hypothetical protein